MTDVSGSPSLFDPFGLWSRLGGVTGVFDQPILPGWQFGDVIVNENNSSSPATERRILGEESYGRQIGRLLDAVCALIERQGGPGDVDAFVRLVALHDKVEALKSGALDDHLSRIREDLARLKAAEDKGAYDSFVAALKAMLPA